MATSVTNSVANPQFHSTPLAAAAAHVPEAEAEKIGIRGKRRGIIRMTTQDRAIPVEVETFYDECASCAAVTDAEAAGKPLKQPDYKVIFAKVPSSGRKEEAMYKPLCDVINVLGRGKYVCEISSDTPDEGDPTLQKVDLAIFSADRKHGDGSPHWLDQVMNVEVKVDGILDDPFDDEGDIFQTNTQRKDDNRQQLASYADMIFNHQPRSFCFNVIVFGRYARIIRWDHSGAIVTRKIDWVLHPEELGQVFWQLSLMTREEQGYDTTVSEVTPEEKEAMLRAKRHNLPKEAAHAHVMFARSLDRSLKTKRPFMKIRVDVERTPDDVTPDAPTYREYLVGEPTYAAPGLTGRCTRTYVALDAKTKDRLVWLKDAWRVDLPGLQREGDTLLMLKHASVENIPTFECHGDVPGQVTLADKLWESEIWPLTSRAEGASASDPAAKPSPDAAVDADTVEHEGGDEGGAAREKVVASGENASEAEDKLDTVEDEAAASVPDDGAAHTQGAEIPPLRRRLKPHVHYRLVVEEVCLKLDDFENGRELMLILYHCAIALQQAFQRLSLLHRDISNTNVLIFVEVDPDGKIKRRGILSDWELAKVADRDGEIAELARQPNRTGTWRFLSAMSLSNSRKKITFQDDMESLWLLALFESGRWLPSTLLNVADFIHIYFEDRDVDPDTQEYICGPWKLQMMLEGKLRHRKKPLLFFRQPGDSDQRNANNLPLNKFLQGALKIFHAYYKCVEEDAPWIFIPSANPEQMKESANSSNDSAEPQGGEGEGAEAEDEERVLTPEEYAMKQYRENAEKLADHHHFIQLFKQCVESTKWADKDKLPHDRRNARWKPEAADRAVGNSSALTTLSGWEVVNPSATGTADGKRPSQTSQLMVPLKARTESSTGSLKRRRSVSQVDEPGPSKRPFSSTTVLTARSQSAVSDAESPPPSPSSEEDPTAVGRDSPTRRLRPGSRRGSNWAGSGSGQAKRGR